MRRNVVHFCWSRVAVISIGNQLQTWTIFLWFRGKDRWCDIWLVNELNTRVPQRPFSSCLFRSVFTSRTRRTYVLTRLFVYCYLLTTTPSQDTYIRWWSESYNVDQPEWDEVDLDIIYMNSWPLLFDFPCNLLRIIEWQGTSKQARNERGRIVAVCKIKICSKFKVARMY